MVTAANLGFPRVGAFRELKKAQESFWKGKTEAKDLLDTAKELRLRHWKLQQDAGVEIIPSNDFTLYDHVLDTICMVGAVPARYDFSGDQVDLDTFFAMARGRQQGGQDVVAMEMTKWFDTNYHYIVPEFKAGQTFKLSSNKAVEQYTEAKEAGVETRPVLVGPVTFLLLGKARDGSNPLDLLPALLPVYQDVLQQLADAGATDVQIDEPALVLDLPAEARAAFETAYAALASATVNITLATYFGALLDNLQLAANLPVAGLHVDLVRAPQQLGDVLDALPKDKHLSVGVVDGRNIWKTNLERAHGLVREAAHALGGERVQVAGSCSLLHSPVDLANETLLDDEVKNWLAFATQKLDEIVLLTNAANDGVASVQAAFDENAAAVASRETSTRIHNQAVKDRAAAVNDNDLNRISAFDARIKAQADALKLPLLPTTTIGSFPQTTEVRQYRAKFKKGEITREQYDAFLEAETKKAMEFQDRIDIDVPVHGEFERNDMVEYFGEKLEGFFFTKNGWVQSYGSRCVKPPVIFGDVSRPNPMTVRWSGFAQAQTKRPVKGMLTGPITILQWSFVRDDQPRSETCKQIGLAIRDEVVDLEEAGIKLIQIDEPAIREGLPLRRNDWDAYLRWAVDCFRLSAAGVEDSTQIHTHMCYSEFNDIMPAIAEMDADVISIETSRSAMELLDAFVAFKYPNEIGPGVYDIHSPRVPNTQEMEHLLDKALEVLKPEQVWVNPDCGLKTRGWEETEGALIKMVEAAKNTRKRLGYNQEAA